MHISEFGYASLLVCPASSMSTYILHVCYVWVVYKNVFYFESRGWWWQYPGDSSQHTFLRCLLIIWVMQVNILWKIINRTMAGWFKSTYFLEMSFKHMGDASQHTSQNHQQENDWVIQVNILSWDVFNHMSDACQHTLENQQQDNGWVIQVNIISWGVF